MIEKKDFLEAYNSFSGYKKLSEMIANDFFEHQDFEVAKKQHFWLHIIFGFFREKGVFDWILISFCVCYRPAIGRMNEKWKSLGLVWTCNRCGKQKGKKV